MPRFWSPTDNFGGIERFYRAALHIIVVILPCGKELEIGLILNPI
jgi:hypothetical protein